MKRRAGVVALLLLVTGVAEANYYKVRNTNDSGYGSLRWAIEKANTHVGSDWIVFDPSLTGDVIQPVTALAPLTDPGTIIDGDINDDGAPDITLEQPFPPQHADPGIHVQADSCRIEGLAIVAFWGPGIKLTGVTGCLIRGCDLGVAEPNAQGGGAQLMLDDSDTNTIGQSGYPNVFGGGQFGTGLLVQDSSYNTVQCNHFGLNRAGDIGLPIGYGLAVSNTNGGTEENVIRNNRFACYVATGLMISKAHRNRVQGNWFGLAADGITVIPGSTLYHVPIAIGNGAVGNVLGGTSAAARNVFAGDADAAGIYITDSTTRNTQIRGNYLGTTADGLECVPLQIGVHLDGCGRQVIGGPNRRAGNHFVLAPGDAAATGVKFEGGGSESIVQNNSFGVFPAGVPAPHGGTSIRIDGASDISILDNRIAYADFGMRFGWTTAAGLTQIHRNTFEHLRRGVYLTNAISACLGDLGNSSTDDDGGNQFALTNTVHILNRNTSRVPAEGNGFGTTVAAEIDARILDQLDWPPYGRVDFDPLQGGLSPSSHQSPHGLALSGAGAVPTAAGAEVVYTLSAPAAVTVTISNLAGRPVATVIQDRSCEAGLRRAARGQLDRRGVVPRAANQAVRVRRRPRGPSGRQPSGGPPRADLGQARVPRATWSSGSAASPQSAWRASEPAP